MGILKFGTSSKTLKSDPEPDIENGQETRVIVTKADILRDDPRRQSKNPWYRLNYWMDYINGETRSVDRVPEDERFDDSYWNSASMWLGANMVLPAYSLGILGSTAFEMSFWDSTLVCIFFTLLGCIPVAALSTLGPPTGLRQMKLTSYLFGSVGGRICALLNCVTCVGWSATNVMAATTTLQLVNTVYEQGDDGSWHYDGNDNLPGWGGIIVINIASMLIAIFGYRIVHAYNKWAWLPNFVVLIVIASRLGMSKDFTFAHLGQFWTGNEPKPWNNVLKWVKVPTAAEASKCLSLGSTIYGFAAGWGPYASDYTCYKPKNSNRTVTFLWIWVIESIACIIPFILGAASVSMIGQNVESSAKYENAYNAYIGDSKNTAGVGGILRIILVDDSLHGFGQFCMVIFALSVIANNIPNLYTFTFSAQAVLPWFALVPSWCWTILCTGVSFAIAEPGYNSFQTFMTNFMDAIAYWVSFYYGVSLAEMILYRRSYFNFNLDVYDDFKKMPFSIAGIFGGLMGCVGTGVAMSQTYYVSPIAELVGDEIKYGAFGADMGFELSFGFGFVGHAILRWIEIIVWPDDSYIKPFDDVWWFKLGKKILPKRWVEYGDRKRAELASDTEYEK